jgi:hypothetical protein
MSYELALIRVRHSAYINTDLSCLFVLAEIHAMAVSYGRN